MADFVFFFLVDDDVGSVSVTAVPSITTDFFRDRLDVELFTFLVELELDFFFFFSGMAGKVKDMGILEQVVLSPNNREELLLLPPPNELLVVLALLLLLLLLLLLFFFLVFLSDDDEVVKFLADFEDEDLEDAFFFVFRSEVVEEDR